MSLKLILVMTLVQLVAVKTTRACKTHCPEVRLELDMTAEEVTLQNLAFNGPDDCICLSKTVPDKWIVRGNEYDLCDKPVCLNTPKGKDIKPEEGKQCPVCLLAKPDETMREYWIRIYNEQKDAPADGWCPPGQQKWIVYGSVIGKDRDTCTCVNDFYWMKKEQAE